MVAGRLQQVCLAHAVRTDKIDQPLALSRRRKPQALEGLPVRAGKETFKAGTVAQRETEWQLGIVHPDRLNRS